MEKNCAGVAVKFVMKYGHYKDGAYYHSVRVMCFCACSFIFVVIVALFVEAHLSSWLICLHYLAL